MSIFAVGSYTEDAPHVPDARGEGIYLIRPEKDRLSLLSTTRGVQNPAYLSWDPREKLLYCISENQNDHGALGAFKLSAHKRLDSISNTSGAGRANCHILNMPERRLVAVASYTDGCLSIYPSDRGRIGGALAEIRYAGSGPNQARQKAPHAHQAVPTPDGKGLLVADLGSDTVWYHGLEELTAPPAAALAVPAGYGPRHMAFDPDGRHAYLLCELRPELLLLRFAPDWRSAVILDELDTVPPEEQGKAAPAAVKIHPSGKSVAVSNRFVNTITVFIIERSHGVSPQLRKAASLPSGGKTPRDIEFSSDGGLLLIANQDSNMLSSRRFSPESGLPLEEGPELELGTPACIVELE